MLTFLVLLILLFLVGKAVIGVTLSAVGAALGIVVGIFILIVAKRRRK